MRENVLVDRFKASSAFRAWSASQCLMIPAHRPLHSWEKKAIFTILNLSYTSTIPFLYALTIFKFCQASSESLQHSAPDLPREREQTVLSPWSPSAEHAAGSATLGHPSDILIPNSNPSPAEHYFFKCYNIAGSCYSLVWASNAEANKIASITFIYIYAQKKSPEKKQEKNRQKKENPYICKKVNLKANWWFLMDCA